jgi:hypothetical protein
VNEPCDGEASADEVAYCCEGAVCAPAESAANETRTQVNASPDTTIMIRRMSPPSKGYQLRRRAF